VAALAVTLVGMVYALLPSGRPRSRGKWAVGGVLFVLGVARLYLAVEHPTDLLAAVILGVAVPAVAFRFFTPNEVFRSPTGAPRPRSWTSVAAAGRPSAPPSRSSWA
jgi:membrane-associated phospholipid phosphatase